MFPSAIVFFFVYVNIHKLVIAVTRAPLDFTNHGKFPSEKQMKSLPSAFYHRAAHVLSDHFVHLPRKFANALVGDEVLLELEPTLKVKGKIEQTWHADAHAFVCSGIIKDGRGGTFQLSQDNGAVVGRIVYEKNKYEIMLQEEETNLHAVRKVDMNSRRNNPPSQKMLAQMMKRQPGAQNLKEKRLLSNPAYDNDIQDVSDGKTPILDVLCMWSAEAQVSNANSESTMKALCRQAVAHANEGIKNSNVNLYVRLLYTGKTSETRLETDMEDQLAYLNDIDDPDTGTYYADVRAKRAELGADHVIFLQNFDANYCGMAYLNIQTDTNNGEYWSPTTCVLSYDCPDSFGHEMGHNLGLMHDIETVGGEAKRQEYLDAIGIPVYAYGHCWDQEDGSCGRSIMSYASCPTPNVPSPTGNGCDVINVFSDPLQDLNAVTGQAYGVTNLADNARLVREHGNAERRGANWAKEVVLPLGEITSVSTDSLDTVSCSDKVYITGVNLNIQQITKVELANVMVQSWDGPTCVEMNGCTLSVVAGYFSGTNSDFMDVKITFADGTYLVKSGAIKYIGEAGCNLAPVSPPTNSPVFPNSPVSNPNPSCGAGMYVTSGYKCLPCFPGTKPNPINRMTCIPCEAGTASPGFSDDCMDCPAGTYALAGSAKCELCRAGTYSGDKSATCTHCLPGTSSTPGASVCTLCSV